MPAISSTCSARECWWPRVLQRRTRQGGRKERSSSRPATTGSITSPATFTRADGGFVHQCPIDRMPLLVRAGSILPMGPKMDFSDQARWTA